MERTYVMKITNDGEVDINYDLSFVDIVGNEGDDVHFNVYENGTTNSITEISCPGSLSPSFTDGIYRFDISCKPQTGTTGAITTKLKMQDPAASGVTYEVTLEAEATSSAPSASLHNETTGEDITDGDTINFGVVQAETT
jgi:hypothetical protein